MEREEAAEEMEAVERREEEIEDEMGGVGSPSNSPREAPTFVDDISETGPAPELDEVEEEGEIASFDGQPVAPRNIVRLLPQWCRGISPIRRDDPPTLPDMGSSQPPRHRHPTPEPTLEDPRFLVDPDFQGRLDRDWAGMFAAFPGPSRRRPIAAVDGSEERMEGEPERRRSSPYPEMDVVREVLEAVIDRVAAREEEEEEEENMSDTSSTATAIPLRRSTRLKRPIERWSYPCDHIKRRRTSTRKPAAPGVRRVRRLVAPQPPPPAPTPPQPRQLPFHVRADPPKPPAMPSILMADAFKNVAGFAANEWDDEIEKLEKKFAESDFGHRGLDIRTSINRLAKSLKTIKDKGCAPTSSQSKRLSNALNRVRAELALSD